MTGQGGTKQSMVPFPTIPSIGMCNGSQGPELSEFYSKDKQLKKGHRSKTGETVNGPNVIASNEQRHEHKIACELKPSWGVSEHCAADPPMFALGILLMVLN